MARNSFGNGLLAWLLEFVFDLLGLIIVWATKILARMSWWLLRKTATHPRTSLTAGLLGGAVYLIGWEIVVGIVGLLILSGSVWKAADRASFDQWIGGWLVAWHRKWWTYRRTWERVMVRCGLALDVDGERHVPKLTRIRQDKYWDKLTVAMQVGQELDDYRSAGEKLRNAFRTQRIDIREVEPASVSLALMHKDPFRHEAIEAAVMPAATQDIDWDRIPLGLTEYLQPWTTPMRGGHLAVCGGTGAGKGSIVGNVLRGLAPAIADGTVVVHMVDPKMVELAPLKALAGTHVPILEEREGGRYSEIKLYEGDETTSYTTGPEDTLAMLRGLVAEMHEDAKALTARKITAPSREHPLHLLIIDEGAPLMKYWPRGTRDKIEDALGQLLTQGRALLRKVICEMQEPTKDAFTMRDLFSERVGLRLPTESHTEAALVDDAVKYGALCHQIPASLPGVGYQVQVNAAGAFEVSRNRAGHVTDDDLDDLLEYVAVRRLELETTHSADRHESVDTTKEPA